MSYRSIRGATTVEQDDKTEILHATKIMLQEIINRNGLHKEDILSIMFTATKDLTAVYPAVGARELGLTNAGIMCMQEMFVEGSLSKCIRVLINVESVKTQKEMQHVYLNEAIRLRPDLVKYDAIAIDGPGGAGKSTVAKAISTELGFVYVDTGAMYRAIALYCIQNQIDLMDENAIVHALDQVEISIAHVAGAQHIFLCDEDVTDSIRTQEVAEGSSKVASIQKVREKLVDLQRDLAKKTNIVMDGRDIGTVVLPNATLKIYLDAAVDQRAMRRIDELKNHGIDATFDLIKKEIEERDTRDMNREISPLKKAEDAIVLDTSDLHIEDVKDAIINLYLSKK